MLDNSTCKLPGFARLVGLVKQHHLLQQVEVLLRGGAQVSSEDGVTIIRWSSDQKVEFS
jgi:hypothetical protein